tara:strand:- start:2483 stop:3097 length:615 start_codon:yes stop_codon:yes gene_type:complete
MKNLLPLLILGACGTGPTAPQPTVVIIGDSISDGYTPFVKSTLDGYAIVSRIPDNARNTAYTLENLDTWIPNHVDLITWNNGLWDCNRGFDNWFTEPSVYEENLRLLAERITVKADKVIFFTTTEIDSDNPGPGGRVRGCEVERNEIAKRVLPEYGITVYDLYPISITNTGHHLPNDDVHFSNEGSNLLSDFVVSSILQTLGVK